MEETSKRTRLRQNVDNLVEKRANRLKDAEDLRKQIEAARTELHKDEVSALDEVCRKKKITYDQICDFLLGLDISLDDAAAIIDRHTKAMRPAKQEIERNDTNE